MYSNRILSNSIFSNYFFNRPNLNVITNVKYTNSDQHFIKCLCTFRNISLSELNNKMNNVVTKVKVFYNKKSLHEIVSKRLHLTPSKLKDQSTIIIRAWTRQCEYIVAQRFRRTQQMFCLYTRLWEERALKEFLLRMRQYMSRRSKEFVFGAMGISSFNWDTGKISDKEILEHMKEFEYVNRLKEETIICKKCNQRRLVDIMLPDIKYCKCSANNNSNGSYTLDEWVPFLERKDLLVWRRQRPDSSNYEYKMYGIYDDVTAEDFLRVQIDTEYRQKWDSTAVNLYVVDTDAQTNSDVIYWEMLWPRMFANRDYVYNRRYMVDHENNVITIINKSIEHPSCPIKPDKHRVNDYQSCMVIRSTEALNKPGIEFSLTYYDDPGVNIPAAVTSWVAIAGMPDFLSKLRLAAKKYGEDNQNEGNKQGVETDGTIPEDVEITFLPTASETETIHQISATSDSEINSTNSNNNSYWRYIHPYYYFG